MGMLILDKLRNKVHEFRERRFLNKHGCYNWKQYHRKYDSDFFASARYVKNAYRGYKFVAKLPEEFYVFPMYLDTTVDVEKWCEENCQGKFRGDWFRCIYDPKYDDYEVNEMGGMDELFYAFQEEKDYMWFKLVWQ